MKEMHPPKHMTNKRKKKSQTGQILYVEENKRFKVQDNEVLQKIR
jgi:hypothetical protein